MTWADRLARRYSGLIALVRLADELRVNAAVLRVVLLTAAAQPVALARDMFPAFDVVLAVIGVK